MIVTVFDLRRLSACSRSIEVFQALFGESVQVTEALCVKHADKFNWDWAASNLLRFRQQIEYTRIQAAARTQRDHICAAAHTECDRICDAAYAECNRICDAAYAECNRICAAAYAECDRTLAAAFGRLAESCVGKDNKL